ncbi:unnamed protein product [Amaranthus hypochondriacus]
MKFKKGAKVEVLTQKDVPSGSWHCAKIIGGDGRFYSVKYDGDVELWGKVVFDKVPRKSIRPSPPPVDVLHEWVSGDVIEVFHNFSWKMATVLEVLGCNYLSVRLLGSAIEHRVSKFDVRPRLCWQDGEWIVIGKASNQGDDLRFRIPSSRKDYNQSHKVDANVSNRTKDYYVGNRSINNAQEHELLPIRKRRKQSYSYRQSEAYTRPKKKTRLEKQFHVMQLPVKVDDDVASSQERLHERCLKPSFVNKVNGCSELIMERDKTDGTVQHSRLICIESDDDNSVSSSVASCSVDRNYSHKLRRVFTTGPFEDNDSQLSDAESFCNLRPKEKKILLPAKEELTEEIHRLELHAYRCTIAALHASGPLTWEHELLLTNLRQSLHISNDEHLKEIRNLVSATTCLPSR